MDSENCARCKNPPPSLPPDTPPAVSSPTHYSFGDVCTVQESLATPIEEIFLTTKSIKSKPWMHTRCKKNHSQLTDPSRPAPGKDRPCVIMSPTPVAANSTDPDTSICLKMTLGGTAYEKLPLIVKYFAIDVASDKQPPPAGREHVHTAETCGEWPHPKQLILAFPFRTKRPIKGLWPRGRANNLPDCPESKRKPGTPLADDGVPAYKYDHDTTAWIVEKSDKLMEMWGEECEEDPNMGPIFEEDFRTCRKIAASTASLASFLSHGSRKKAASRPPTPRKRQTKANSALGGESQLCASPSSSKGSGRTKSTWVAKPRRSNQSMSLVTGDV